MGHGAGEHGTEFTAVVVILLYAETTNLSQALECGNTVFWADEILCAGLVTMLHVSEKLVCAVDTCLVAKNGDKVSLENVAEWNPTQKLEQGFQGNFDKFRFLCAI